MLWTDEQIERIRRSGEEFTDPKLAASYMRTVMITMRDEYEARIAELETEGEWLNRADKFAFDKASLEIDQLRERVAELEREVADSWYGREEAQ